MSMPFYVPTEQLMKDKADYARKGIARGRALAALLYADGIVICAENPSNTLHKVAEIYDRIAFAGVGKYNEFDQLRKFGVRTADLTREEAVDLALKALFQAADEDSATGGPDLVRGIYPTMATITGEGFTALERDEIAQRFQGLLDSMDGGLAS